MICKFCKKDKILKNSHIIPEFFYKPLYDSKHKMIVMERDKEDISDKWKIQKGIREYLLCGDCEEHFNKSFENKFKIHWYDKKKLFAKNESKPGSHCANRF